MNKVQIIRKPYRETFVRYSRVFQLIGASEGTGLALDCDEHGNLERPAHASILADALQDSSYEDRGIRKHEWSYRHGPLIRCHCGRKLACDNSWLNTCDCGRDYNGNGSLLAPRSQWGEDTGESLSDIITGPYNGDNW